MSCLSSRLKAIVIIVLENLKLTLNSCDNVDSTILPSLVPVGLVWFRLSF